MGTRGFTTAVAVLLAPRSTLPSPRQRSKDILIMNPLGDIIAPELYGSSVAGGEASPAPNAARAVLLHYASIIDRVGGEGGILFATRLRTLADPVRETALLALFRFARSQSHSAFPCMDFASDFVGPNMARRC